MGEASLVARVAYVGEPSMRGLMLLLVRGMVGTTMWLELGLRMGM